MIDHATVRRLTAAALENIERHRRRVNALNVYPVPDGDTGTNLEKTMQGIVAELDRSTAATTAQLAADVQRARDGGQRELGVILRRSCAERASSARASRSTAG